jgi:arabinan endo-1,5-alpha-L-arabinosidase
VHRLAWNEEIEAPCLTRRNDHYYLFVNWGKCCRGTNSTYEVRVGRSQKVTGPYLDHEGVDLVEAGGKPFLKTSGRFIGPGHIAILAGTNHDTFSYHYYDRESRGRSRLAIARLRWTDDGWPEAVTVSD